MCDKCNRICYKLFAVGNTNIGSGQGASQQYFKNFHIRFGYCIFICDRSSRSDDLTPSVLPSVHLSVCPCFFLRASSIVYTILLFLAYIFCINICLGMVTITVITY